MAEVTGATVSTKTVKALKDAVRELRKEVEGAELGTKTWADKSKELAEAQKELSEATAMTKGSVADLSDTYQELVIKTNELRRKWRVTPVDSDEFKALGEQIAENNEKLKNWDAEIGDYFRNVGNYSGGIADALNKMGLSLGGLMPRIKDTVEGSIQFIGAIKNIRGVMPSLITQVWAYVASLSAVKKALIATGIGAFVVLLGTLIAHWEDITRAIKNFINGAEESTDIIQNQNRALENQINLLSELGGEHEHELNLLRAQGKATIDVLREALNLATEEIKKTSTVLNTADDIVQKIAHWKDSSDEAQKAAYDAAKKNYDDANAAYKDALQKSLNINRQIEVETTKLETKKKKNAEDAAKAKVKKAEETAKKLFEIEQEAKYTLMGEEEREITRLKASYAEKVRLFREAGLSITELAKALTKELGEINKKYREREKADLEAARAKLHAYNATVVQEEVADAKKKYDNKARYAELETENESDKAKKLYTIQQEALNNELQLLQSALDAKNLSAEKELEIKRRIADITLDIAYNTASEEKRLSEEVRAKKQADAQSAWEVSSATASATSSILGSIADMYEAEGEANIEATKKAKNLRIAGATMDMLGGIVSAWSSALNPANAGMTIWGQIAMAGITSATMLATGIANIAKIRNTDTSGSASGSVGASVIAPSIVQQVPVTRTLTGVAEEERMNQSQRVYVVYDDIAEAGRKTEVTEQESTF